MSASRRALGFAFLGIALIGLAAASLWSRFMARPSGGDTGTSSAASDPPARGTPTNYYSSVADSVRALRIAREARQANGLRILIPLREHRLFVVRGTDTLAVAAAAVPSGTTLNFAGRRWTFLIPPARRQVIARKIEPQWVPPDWHYAEVAAAHGLALRALDRGRGQRLRDGTRLQARGFRIGIVGRDGRFVPLPPTDEVVADSTLFIPPEGTANRTVEGELGAFGLDLGDGYLIHGTPHTNTIGQAVTHGCFRLGDADIEWLYRNIPVGTPVFIY